ncbi:MAG: hypothetical protein AB1714_01890 [Acidobacteriota bacterium]
MNVVVVRKVGVLLFACQLFTGARISAAGSGSWGGKEMEEGELVKKRHEWFISSRLAGSDGRMAEKRWLAVEQMQRATASRPADASMAWRPKGPFSSNFSTWRFGPVSGRIACLAKDFKNNVLYVGSASGGLWKSTTDGASWDSIFDGAGTQTVGAIAIDPINPKNIWVGTGENVAWCEEYFGIGLLRSTDGGATWQRRNGSGATSLENLSTFASIIVDPRSSSRLIVGGARKDCVHGHYISGGIYTSDDAGATWTNRLSDAYVTRIVIDPRNPGVLWAGVGGAGVYRSVDGGNSWALQTGLSTGSVGRVEVAVAPSDSKVVYALFESVNRIPEFWRTTNAGASWIRMTSGRSACDGQCWYNMVLAVHPTSSSTVYRGNILLFRSTNGGATWAELTGQWGLSQKVHQDTHALLIDPAHPGVFYVGCDGGIWKTVNGGASFTNRNSNLSITQFYDVGIHPTDNNIIVGGSQDNSSLARSSGDRWDLMEVTGDGFVSIINPVTPSTVYTASYPWDDGDGALPGVIRSDDGLLGPYSWITSTANGLIAGDRIGWVTPYALDPSNPKTLFLGTHRIYRSQDGGNSWRQTGPDDMAGGDDYLNTVHVSSTNGAHVYAGTTNGRIWSSADGGATWREISLGLPSSRWINDIASDPTNPARAFCVVSGFGTAHLYECGGQGAWTPRRTGLPDVPANSVVMTGARTIYVGTDVGVYRSTDRALHFVPFNAGMPSGLVVTDLEYNKVTRCLTAGTYGRGAWQAGSLKP